MGNRRASITGGIRGGRRLSLLLFAFLAVFTVCADSFAKTVSLQWDPNTEADLAGYKIYYKTETNSFPFDGTGAAEGASPVDVIKQTTTSISGLDAGETYFFTVTAYNTSGLESSYSNIVTVAESLPPMAAISSPANNSAVSGTVSINVDASDNVAVSKVEYYVNGSLSFTSASAPYTYFWDTSALTGGNYTLLAKAYDAAGNVGQSGNVVVTVSNDRTAPVASLAAPASGATLNGTVTISAAASDNIGVTRVEFYANGVLLAATNTMPYTYNWNTASYADGSYSLSVKAYDNSGNVGQSGAVTVTVINDTAAPTVAITTPAANATVSGTVAIQAAAADNVGVSRVEFYVNGLLKSSASAAPYSYAWDTKSVINGSYTLSAIAYDAAGNVGQSGNTTVTVANDTTAPVLAITVKSLKTETIGGTVSDNVQVSSVKVAVGSGLPIIASVSGTTWSCKVSLATGINAILVTATDSAGNSSSVTTTMKKR